MTSIVGKYFTFTQKILLLSAQLVEIAGMDMLVSEADVCGFSGDNEFCKLAWKQSNDIIQNIDHTLAADCGLSLSEELEIVNEEDGVCYRATYIVDPKIKRGFYSACISKRSRHRKKCK